MAASSRSWLPEHQEHVVFTLAHVDELIEQTGDVLFDYLRRGVFDFETVADGSLAHVKIAGVEPLPQGVARTAASAMTQMRAAIEHTLFAEVVHEMGRELTADEEKRVEMPATKTEAEFNRWMTGRKRAELPPLRSGSGLLQRVRDLQPLRRRDTENHPLTVLAEHTNLAKHRTPSVAATRLGAVIPDHEAPSLTTADEPQPVAVGDTIATGPLYERVPISIWPNVAIQRPHTATWHTVMNELAYLEEWVRTTAIPHLILGERGVEPLPPRVDSSVGHADFDAAYASRTSETAAQRAMTRVQAVMLREALVETLVLDPSRPAETMLQAWVAGLSDAEVVERQERLSRPASRRDLAGVQRAVVALLTEARAATAAE